MNIVDFHTRHLMGLTRGNASLVDASRYVCDSICMLNAGATNKLALWHLGHLQGLVPEVSEIAEAVYLLEQCIRYGHEA